MVRRSEGRSAQRLAEILAIVFLATSALKLTGLATKNFERWGHTRGFMWFVGACELAGAVGLLVPATKRIAAAALTILMLGAVQTHLTHHEGWQALLPAALVALLATTWWLHRKAE